MSKKKRQTLANTILIESLHQPLGVFYVIVFHHRVDFFRKGRKIMPKRKKITANTEQMLDWRSIC